MAKARALVKRRKAIRNIRKITRTMELIATARFKKAMDRATEAEAYTRKIAELVADLAQRRPEVSIRCWRSARRSRTAVLLVLTRQPRPVRRLQRQRPARGRSRDSQDCRPKASTLHARSRPASAASRTSSSAASRPTQTYTHFEDKPQFDEVEVLANRYLDDVHRRQARPARRGLHEVRQRRPGRRRWSRRCCRCGDRAGDAATQAQPAAQPTAGRVRVPAVAESILEEVVPVSFKVRLFKCFLDAAVSEQIARMVAMKAATENADDMIKRLTHAVQPRPPGADHRRDHGDHRRRRGAEDNSQL